MSQPLHEAIADDLRRRIATGELAVGAVLPSESTLRVQWGGSRGPIRQALANLRADGLIAGGRGKPPVVRRQQHGQPFDSLVSFSKWAQGLDRVPGQRTMEIARRAAAADVAEALEVEPGHPVVELVRVRLLDDEPIMIERTTFVARWGDLLFAHSPDRGSIYAHLTEQGLQVGSAHHVIDAVLADPSDHTLLTVPVGSPLLRERRITRSAVGEPFEYSDDRYRPDRVTFTIDNAPQDRPLLDRAWHADAAVLP